MKIHVIGDADAVLGFSLIGATGRVASTAQEVEKALEAAARDPDIGVILVTEGAAALASAKVDALRVSRSGPVVVEIPGPEGPLAERPSFHDVIARATGIRL